MLKTITIAVLDVLTLTLSNLQQTHLLLAVARVRSVIMVIIQPVHVTYVIMSVLVVLMDYE